LKKKWLIVGMAAVLVLIGIVVLTQQNGKSPEEKALDEVLPKTQSAGSVPAIEYVPVAEANGLKVKPKVIVDHWERGVLSASVSIENTRDEMLVTAKMTVTSISQSGARSLISSVSVNRLKSGETVTLNLDMLEVLNVSDIKKVEISFDGQSVIWEEPTAAIPEPKQPETTIPSQAIAEEPEKIVEEWYNLMSQGEFLRVLKLYSLSVQQEIKALGGVTAIAESWQRENIVKIEIERGRTEIEDSKAYVYVLFDYSTGVTEDRVSFYFKKIEGQWKIAETIKKVY